MLCSVFPPQISLAGTGSTATGTGRLNALGRCTGGSVRPAAGARERMHYPEIVREHQPEEGEPP